MLLVVFTDYILDEWIRHVEVVDQFVQFFQGIFGLSILCVLNNISDDFLLRLTVLNLRLALQTDLLLLLLVFRYRLFHQALTLLI